MTRPGRLCAAALLLLLLPPTLLAEAAAPVAAKPAEPLPAGATIVGDSDAAIGLYLTPWKDEEPLPPGRNPSNFTIEAAAADAAADRARSEGLDSIEGYRRAHRHSYGN